MEPSPRPPADPGVPPRTGPPAVPGQRGPHPGDPGAAPPPPRRRWSHTRAVLAVAGGVLALLCLGGIGLGFVWYDEETKPDRSAPSVVADSYLRALLVERDSVRAGVFVCRRPHGLAEVEAFAVDIGEREKELAVSISVNLEDLRVVESRDGRAAVTVAVRRTAAVDDVRQSIVDRWRLTLSDESGWRVCGAERVS